MKNKFEYILNVFKQVYGITWELPVISYGTEPAGTIFIRQGNTRELTEKKAVCIKTGDIIWQEWRNRKIPFFFSNGSDEIIEEKEGKWIINLDIIASAFFYIYKWQKFTK